MDSIEIYMGSATQLPQSRILACKADVCIVVMVVGVVRRGFATILVSWVNADVIKLTVFTRRQYTPEWFGDQNCDHGLTLGSHLYSILV